MPGFRRRDGFSLVELLIVITIVSVLVVISVPIYSSSLQLTRDRGDEANLRTLNSATLIWVVRDANNDSRDETTESMKSKLAVYLEEWPISPNSKEYVLENGYWKVE